MFQQNYQYKQPKTLLSQDNAKTIKGEKLGYQTYILYTSPDKQNTKGKSLCAHSTPGCRTSCLFTAGRGKFTNVALARLHKAEYFLNDRKSFMEQIATEITSAIKKHGENKICIRLNGTSDIPYENIPVGEYPNIMTMFPNVQFYDYTKNFARLTNILPNNYHLTFSRAETELNKKQAELALQLGHNVAMVFNVKNETELPNTYMNYNVINGDEHDLTFIHPKNVIVGLKAKGDAKKDTSGFVIRDF
jgi:hypothetical protein